MGAASILLTIVVVLAIQNINREKHYMSRILSEKGAALIRAFEAGTRTGMMGMQWGENQVQSLLEETARQPGILYLTVTDNTGLILAHSDRAQIGHRFRDELLLKTLNPGPREQWRVTDSPSGQRSFEVYRYFRPWRNARVMPGKDASWKTSCGPAMTDSRPNWCFPLNRSGKEQIIFVGLDVEPFEAARKEDIRNTIIISAVLLLLGLGGIFSMFLAQSYLATKRLLQDTSAFANELVSNLPVGLIATNRFGKIVFFNEAAEKITGLTFNEVRGQDPHEALFPRLSDLKVLFEQEKSILEQELECVLSDQNTVHLSVSTTKIVNEEGIFVGKLLILRDLGEVRRLQEEIRRKEKFAALGGLAAGIAHEIRNPLSSIKGLATYFGSKFAEGSEDREVVGVMVQEVDRLNRVVSELLEFARPSEPHLKLINVNEILEHSVRLIQQDAKTKNIAIHLLKGANLPLILLDSDRFTQCLLNLYLNAIQAMDKGGVLSVRSLKGSNQNIRVEIEDTGKGINPDDLNKIFDPYFTTKTSGTGLGLAIVHRTIESHQGSIKVRSAPGRGTIFTISLPVQVDEKQQERVP